MNRVTKRANTVVRASMDRLRQTVTDRSFTFGGQATEYKLTPADIRSEIRAAYMKGRLDVMREMKSEVQE